MTAYAEAAPYTVNLDAYEHQTRHMNFSFKVLKALAVGSVVTIGSLIAGSRMESSNYEEAGVAVATAVVSGSLVAAEVATRRDCSRMTQRVQSGQLVEVV